MRIIFIGVVDIGWQCLKALLESGANVVGIFTADKQGMVKISSIHPDYFSEFEDLASRYDVSLFKIKDTTIPLDTKKIKQLQPDIIFCIGWPQIIGKEILRIPRHGCVGIHPTLLPQRRGGAPINWSLIDGLTNSGVTLFYFDEGVDSGNTIAQGKFEITLQDTAGTCLDKVTNVAVELIKEYYPLLEKGKAPCIPQNDDEATYTRRRRPEDGVIDWSKTSLSIYNWIRALSLPFPGAFTYWTGKKVIVWESELLKGYRVRFNAQRGEILDSLDERGMIVATGDNCILIKMVEVNGEQISGDEFLRRYEINQGNILESHNKMVKILVIAPHPDDEVLGCGGMIVKHVRGGDANKDHRLVFDAAMVAVRPKPGVVVKRVLYYETLSETEWTAPFPENAFIPNVFTDISETLEVKLEAMSAYKSELKEFPHPRSPEAITSLAKTRGATIGVKAAEAFMLIREMVLE